MRTAIIAAVMIALLPATAYSQEHQPATRRTDAQKKQDAEIEKAYEEVTKSSKTKGPAKPWDPWQTVRPPTADNAKR